MIIKTFSLTSSKTNKLVLADTNSFFSAKGYAWIINNSDEEIYVSLNPDMAIESNGTAKISSGSCGMLEVDGTNKNIYAIGSGKIEVRITSEPICPFKAAVRGGDKTHPNYLIQYGMVSSAAASVDITFPHAYPDVPVVTATARGSTAAAVAVDNITQTGFTAIGGNINWVAVAMIPKATIISQPKDAVGVTGGNAVFRVEATGNNLTYQWQGALDSNKWYNQSFTGAKTNQMTISGLKAAWNGAKYRCKITDIDGASILSDTATLTVTEG